MPNSAKLPKFEDWTPPWGEDADDIDAEKAAKFTYGLLSDKEKLQTKVNAANEKIAEANTAREEAEKALAEVNSKGTDKTVADLQAKLTEAETKRKAAESLAAKYGVALDEGLTKVQAKRLVGETEDELKADAEELVQSFGGTGKRVDEDGEDEDDASLRRTPQSLRNPADGAGGGENTVIDIDKAIAGIPRNTF
jgi:hypothetical protein